MAEASTLPDMGAIGASIKQRLEKLETDVPARIPKTGSAGTVSSYETVASVTTISQSSASAVQTASAVTVSNGTSGTAWQKIVRLTGTSPSVTLGSSWTWKDDATPTLTTGGLLVLVWCGSGGIAAFVSATA